MPNAMLLAAVVTVTEPPSEAMNISVRHVTIGFAGLRVIYALGLLAAWPRGEGVDRLVRR